MTPPFPSRTTAPGTPGSSGFTLVELMVVVSIVAILSGIAATFMRTPRDERALKASSNAITSLIAQARNRAMSNGNAVIMRFESHEPLYDPILGRDEGIGSRESRIEIFDGTTADCSPRESTTLIPARILDPTAQQLPYRNAVLSRVAPANASGVGEVCFTPTGRVVDPLTGRPLVNVGSSAFGGRMFLEFRPTNCRGSECTLNPDRRVVSIGFNGLTEVMPSDFDIGAL